MFSFVNSITSTEMQTLIAPLFVQLAVSSVQQIFRCRVVADSLQHKVHNETYKMTALYVDYNICYISPVVIHSVTTGRSRCWKLKFPSTAI